MTYCDICEHLDNDKRTGICATCRHNSTYTSHLKVSKQVSRIMEHFGHTLDDIVEDKKE